jgi:hypothetical protein
MFGFPRSPRFSGVSDQSSSAGIRDDQFRRRVGGGAGVALETPAQVKVEQFQVAVPILLDRFVGCRSAALRLSRAGCRPVQSDGVGQSP